MTIIISLHEKINTHEVVGKKIPSQWTQKWDRKIEEEEE